MPRRSTLVAALAVAAVALPAAAGAGSFHPRSHVLSRTTLAGVTPKLSYAQVQTRWGADPLAARRTRPGWGRSFAQWGDSGVFNPIPAWAYFADGVGSQPIMYAVDVVYSTSIGIRFRTPAGDRAGTPIAAFRRHWPQARRLRADGSYRYFVAQSAYRGWRMTFLFDNGRLKEVGFARSDLVEACLVKRCPNGFPAGPGLT
jgi:hypothetical protein